MNQGEFNKRNSDNSYNNLNQKDYFSNNNINLNNFNSEKNFHIQIDKHEKVQINDNYVNDINNSGTYSRQASKSSTNLRTMEDHNISLSSVSSKNSQNGNSEENINFNSFPDINLPPQNMDKTGEIKAKMKEILIEHIKEKIQKKVVESMLYFKQTEDYLGNARLHLDYRAQKLSSVLDTSDNVLDDLSMATSQKKRETENYQKIIDDKKDKYITKENCFSYYEKDNKADSLLDVICQQATIEDILLYTKKGFEKGALSLDEIVKVIRLYSRELYKLNFYKNKLLKRLAK